MQQTEKYKLNLIESSDPFLPDALNANTQRLEEVVSGHLEGMDQRVTVLEAHKFAYGICPYVGNGNDVNTPYHVELGFAPKAVIIVSPADVYQIFISVDVPQGQSNLITLEETGFTLTRSRDRVRAYIAIA